MATLNLSSRLPLKHRISEICSGASDPGAGECVASEIPQDVPTAALDAHPATEPSVVDDAVPLPPVEAPVLDLEALQQFADVVFSHVEQFLPADTAEQLRGHSLALLASVAVLGLLILVGVLKMLQCCFKESSVLLCGPMDAGKTTLFHVLQGHTLPSGTVTSMTASTATCTVPLSPLNNHKRITAVRTDRNAHKYVDPAVATLHGATHAAMGSSRYLQVVDVPGHPRLRSTFDSKVNAASGVVFMLDSSTFISDKHAVAGHLYDVLKKQAACRGPKKPLLLACNKSDLGERAFSQDFIVRQLEKEMAAFRESHHAALAPGNSKGTAGDGLCDVDAKFSLSELSVPVDVCTMSALAGDFSVLPEFLSKL